MSGPLVLRVEGHAPDVRLASNDRSQLYRFARSELVAVEFTRAVYVLRGQVPDGWPIPYKVPVSVAFKMRLEAPVGRRSGGRDVDNLAGAAKPWIDALTMGRGHRDGIGVLYDDNPKWVRRVSYEVDLTAGEAYTEITIEET